MDFQRILKQEADIRHMLAEFVEDIARQVEEARLPGVIASESSSTMAIVPLSMLKYGLSPETYLAKAQADAVRYALGRCGTATKMIEQLDVLLHKKMVVMPYGKVFLNPRTLEVLTQVKAKTKVATEAAVV